MKHIHLHHPHAATHLPAHELAARRRRAVATLPLPRKPSRPAPTPIHPGRKTVDTRFHSR